jgi:hypothetical protein
MDIYSKGLLPLGHQEMYSQPNLVPRLDAPNYIWEYYSQI